MDGYPDDAPSSDKLTKVQEHINHILEAISWELQYNITFIVANLSPHAKRELELGKNPI